MCEVQGPGGAPGSNAGKGRASTPPGRLSVSSSESEEKAPKHSLLGSSEDGLSNEPAEGTTNSRDDSEVEVEKEKEEEEEDSSSEVVVVTLNIVEKKEDDDGDDDEEEEEDEKKKINDKTKIGEINTDEMKVKERMGSESDAKEVQGCVCDENEIENLENERRDELLENTLKRESGMKEDKVEENSPENDEGASAADSLKEVKLQKQNEDEKEEKEEEKKDGKEQIQKEVIVKEEEKKEKEEMTSKHSLEDQKKAKEKEEETKEIAKEKEKELEETKETKENEKQEEGKEAEGVDPFSAKCAMEEPRPPTTTKVSKTVNFLESELKAISERKRHTINSYTSSSSSSSSKPKETGEAKDEDVLERLEADEKTSKHWTIGEGNPVYRLSLKLSPNLFNVTVSEERKVMLWE
ncbi:hypothetical protein E2C01_073075 [Portunus trituberculatus]|uniref:Uncharacterized protein n=1 Tax=Portunus trituberculatus TaxID=210409 RepID=A0A5B7ID34_PORTR|nr:hypothetical protein [Portunus trituberculatus]